MLTFINLLGKHGFSNIINIHIDLLQRCKIDCEALYNCENKLDQAIELMSDERSKESLRNLFSAKVNLNLETLFETLSMDQIQYFDDDILKLSNEEVFVDGGAFDANVTAYFMAKTRGMFKKIYLFEPDKQSYLKASKNVNFLNDDRLYLSRLGLYDSRKDIGFIQSGTIGSSISEFGNDKIEVDCLDNLVDEASFIKMDIEGAEVNALMGTRRLIQTCRPKLAICIYHKIEHLWEIPLLIKELCPDYRLYVRHYRVSDTLFEEAVCYAV